AASPTSRRSASSPPTSWAEPPSSSSSAPPPPSPGSSASPDPPGLLGELDPALDLAGERGGQGGDVVDQGVEVDRADHPVGAVAQDGGPVAAAGQERVHRDRIGDAGVVGTGCESSPGGP